MNDFFNFIKISARMIDLIPELQRLICKAGGELDIAIKYLPEEHAERVKQLRAEIDAFYNRTSRFWLYFNR